MRVLRVALDEAEQGLAREHRELPSAPLANNHGIDLGAFAERLYKDRALRPSYLGPDLFGEPAWDILLDLYVAHQTGKKISVTSSCIGSRAPATTGLRWLKELERDGLVQKRASKSDARRRFVELTPLAVERMTDLLLHMLQAARE